MTILYLHQYFTEPYMAGSTRSYELARRLVRRGHSVEMITTHWQRGNSTATASSKFTVRDVEGIRVHATPLPYSNRMPFRRRIRTFIQFAWRAGRYARRLQYDLVFATSTPLTIAVPGMRLANARDVPFVFEVRDLWPELPIAIGAIENPLAIHLARRIERAAYENASRIVLLSPDMRQSLATRGIPEEKLIVIPNGCDLDLFGERQAEYSKAPDIPSGLLPAEATDHSVVLYAGTLGLINNVSYLVRVAHEAKKRNANIRFLVLGDGAMATEVKQLARQLGVLDDTFFMHPPLPKRQMPRVFAEADVAFSLFADYPQMWANSANKFFDAIASGTPVAINYQGWQAELIRKHKTGIVVPADDPESAAVQLTEFLADPARVAHSAQNARRLAETHFDRDDQARALAEVFEAAVGADMNS